MFFHAKSLAIIAIAAALSSQIMAASQIHNRFSSTSSSADKPFSNHFDARLQSNTFVWNSNKANAKNIIRYTANPKNKQIDSKVPMFDHYFNQVAGQLGANKLSMADSRLNKLHDTGRGGLIAEYQQLVGDIPVFGRNIKLLVDRKNQLVAASGYFSSPKKSSSSNFAIDYIDALAIGFKQNTGLELNVNAVKAIQTGIKFSVNDSALNVDQIMSQNSLVKKVYFPSSNENLVPAYYVEMDTSTKGSKSSLWKSYVVDANSGKILFSNNLTAHVDTNYKIFADTSGNNAPFDGPQGNALTPHPDGVLENTPAVGSVFVSQNSVILNNAGLSTDDPWLTALETSTSGNNVDAYADISGEDGFDATDVRPEITSANSFDYDFGMFADGLSGDGQKSAVVNLFYVNNFLHDWFYDNGFDEAAGNAQVANFGRGGSQGDPLLVEAQDSSGTNNANMSTPQDGGSPRMQMFLWTFLSDSSVEVSGVTNIESATASFGASDFDITAIMFLADDGTGNLNDACEAINSDLTGLIAIIERGDCNFTVKVKNAQDVGAVGVIMVNNVTGGVIIQGGDDSTVTIPSMMVSLEKGDEIKAALVADANLQARLFNQPKPIDGTLDNGIIAHEWGHYLTNRLVGNANGLSNNQGRAMGEGWSDFIALLMTVRESDNLIAGNESFQGVYSASTFVGDAYYGIRRAPYSTDMNKNALTFKHIENGVSLPLSHPTSFGVSGANNAQIHATGEIWANALWESYVGLINKPSYSFDQAQQAMKDYLIASLKMTPNAPTMLEARDALLAVAAANDSADFNIIREAFSKRGMGVAAVSPDRSSIDHAGVVEDFEASVDLQLGISLDKTSLQLGSCDNDGVLDVNEVASYILTVKNYSATAIPAFVIDLSSDNSLTFLSNQITFDSIAAFGVETSATFQLTLDSATQQENIIVTATIAEIGAVDDFFEPAPQSISIVGQFDFALSVFNDDINDQILSENDWQTVVTSNVSPFAIENGSWHGIDSGVAGSSDLITPIIKVASSGDLVLSFDHYFFFESSEDTSGVLQNWDAGVIEVSVNGGAFVDVVDFGAILSEPYNGVVSNSTTVLSGRNAYTFTRDEASSLLESASVTFPDGLVNGQDIQVRFRIGTDANTGDIGWIIDNLVVTNANAPMFSEIVAEDNVCVSANAPVADAGENITVVSRDGSAINITLSGSASDLDGDPLTISWLQRSGSNVSLNNADSLTPDFELSALLSNESFSFELTVDDGTQTATDIVKVSIQVNQAPTVVVNGGSVVEGNQFTLTATASDNESDPLTYTWTQTAGPSVSLSDASVSNPSFTAPEVSSNTTLSFSVVVNDGSLDSTPATANVIVTNSQLTSSSGGGGGGSLAWRWLLLLGLGIATGLRKKMGLDRPEY